MPSRTETLTGVLRPEVDTQQLNREARKVSNVMGSAVEDLVPGGRSLGRLARRLRSGGGGGGGGTAGGGGGTSVQVAQLKKLEDIEDSIDKLAVTQAKGGGGGGGGVLGTLGGLKAASMLSGAGGAAGAAAAFALPVTIVGMASTISRQEQVEALRSRGTATERMDRMLPPGARLPGTGVGFGRRRFQPDNVNPSIYTDPRRSRTSVDTSIYTDPRRSRTGLDSPGANMARDGKQKLVHDVNVSVDLTGNAQDVSLPDRVMDRISKKVTRELEGKIGGGSTGLRLTNK